MIGDARTVTIENAREQIRGQLARNEESIRRMEAENVRYRDQIAWLAAVHFNRNMHRFEHWDATGRPDGWVAAEILERDGTIWPLVELYHRQRRIELDAREPHGAAGEGGAR